MNGMLRDEKELDFKRQHDSWMKRRASFYLVVYPGMLACIDEPVHLG